MSAIIDSVLFKLPDFMASSTSKKTDSQRPHPPKSSKSFPKTEPVSPARSSRGQRASTIQIGVKEKPLLDKTNTAKENRMPRMQSDPIEKRSRENKGPADEGSGKLPADFDELPIELVSLTDR